MSTHPHPTNNPSISTWILLSVLCLLLLGACGGTKRFLGPPGMSVQEIELIDGHYSARVRLDSPASMPLELERLDWKFLIDGKPAANGSSPLSLTLAPVAGDVLRIDLGSEQSLPRLSRLGPNDVLIYVLEGELKVSKPNVQFPIRYEGRLRPTPGKPGSFR